MWFVWAKPSSRAGIKTKPSQSQFSNYSSLKATQCFPVSINHRTFVETVGNRIFLLRWFCRCCCVVTQLYSTLCDPMNYIVHGILQARILDRVAFPFSRGSSQPTDRTQVSHMVCRFFTNWATREALWVLHLTRGFLGTGWSFCPWKLPLTPQ